MSNEQAFLERGWKIEEGGLCAAGRVPNKKAAPEGRLFRNQDASALDCDCVAQVYPVQPVRQLLACREGVVRVQTLAAAGHRTLQDISNGA